MVYMHQKVIDQHPARAFIKYISGVAWAVHSFTCQLDESQKVMERLSQEKLGN